MAIIIGDQDLLRVTLFQRLFSQQVLNVFYFVFEGVSSSSIASVDGFWTEFLVSYVNALRPLTSSQLAYESAQVTLMEAPDFFTATYVIGSNGNVVGDCLPPMVSTGIQYRMTSRAVRTGYKRFAGIPEVQAVNGGIGSPFDVQWRALATSWEAGLLILNDFGDEVGTCRPVVVSTKNWVDGEPTLFRRAEELQWVSQLGTQNTRKIGRGS